LELHWNELKSSRLKRTRGASFEDVIEGRFIGALKHPRLEHQQVLLFYYHDYIWVVPCIEDSQGFFLKTLYRSRKYTKKFLRGEYEKNETDKN
jgi:hypothetical protein